MGSEQGEGDARPERLLHRFFSGIAQAWRIMHEYNKRLLPPQKLIRVGTPSKDRENPYLEVGKDDLEGVYDFEFKANIFNTSRLRDSWPVNDPRFSNATFVQPAFSAT